jgi:hypothetical protein
MDNCGCNSGSPFNNDNGMNSMNSMNNMNSMNSMNPVMNGNMNANGNNSNAVLNNVGNTVQQLPNTNLQSNNAAASEILKAIAKNNIQQLNAEAEMEAQQNVANANGNVANVNVAPVNNAVANNSPASGSLSMTNAALLTLAVIVALAWNDTIKYYIGRMIKLNKGSPYLYLYYSLIVTLVAVIAHNLVSRN